MTHPLHPWFGLAFVLLAVRQTWSEDRVFFLDAQGRQFSLPVGSTGGKAVIIALRRRLIAIPARLIRHSRTLALTLRPAPANRELLSLILTRLSALPAP